MFHRCVCAAGILMLASVCGIAAEYSEAASTASPPGRWEGVAANASGLHIAIVLDIAKAREGGWTGSAIFPEFGVKGAQLGDLSVDLPAVTFTVKGAMGDPKIAAMLGDDGTLKGTYEQAGSTLHLSLKRVGEAQVDYPRQSTAIQKELEGGREGVLDIGAFKMRLGLKLANAENGPATGQLILLDSGNYSPTIEWISQERDNLELSVPAVNFGFEGRLDKASDELRGVLRVGSLEFPLVWRRSAK
jgi:hypothetical protein